MSKGAITFTEPSATRQSFKDECDINQIMSKYIRTGIVEHVKSHGPRYGYVPAVDFQTALNTVSNVEEMFSELPAVTRAKFENDPYQFLAYVQNPENYETLRELGLEEPVSLPVEPPAAAQAQPGTPTGETEKNPTSPLQQA